jgi:hypothetical protein
MFTAAVEPLNNVTASSADFQFDEGAAIRPDRGALVCAEPQHTADDVARRM